MSDHPTHNEASTWIVCVVVLKTKRPRTYKNFYLGVSGSREDAEILQERIAKKGFRSGEDRYFPDQIETLSLKQGDNKNE